jgi:hypothetical protein
LIEFVNDILTSIFDLEHTLIAVRWILWLICFLLWSLIASMKTNPLFLLFITINYSLLKSISYIIYIFDARL